MACNRLYLKCRSCGETIILGKTMYGKDGWYNVLSEKEKGEELNKFIYKHSYCGDTIELHKHPFELEYED